MACSLFGLYLNRCCVIVNWALRNKCQWNFNKNMIMFIQENEFENIVCKMAAILSRPKGVKRNCFLNINPVTLKISSLCYAINIKTMLCNCWSIWLQWASWHIISLNCLFNSLFRLTSKKKIQGLHYCPFVRGIHWWWWQVGSPHKGPVMQKAFPGHDIIMYISQEILYHAWLDRYIITFPQTQCCYAVCKILP